MLSSSGVSCNKKAMRKTTVFVRCLLRQVCPLDPSTPFSQTPVQPVQASAFSGPIRVSPRGVWMHGQSLKRKVGLYRTVVSNARPKVRRRHSQFPASARSVQAGETKQARLAHPGGTPASPKALH